MDLYELRQLAAFAERGTLSAAAEALHLSQPALSRNMKKLEEELGVALFERRKNRLALNENGEYVLRLARELLSSADGLPARVQEFDRRHRAITVGLCAPAPGWLLTPLLSSIYPGRMLQTEILPWNKLLEGLDSGRFQLAVLAREPESGRYFSRECGRESLMFALPPSHRFARRESLSFADMDGETMLLMEDIGFWDFVRTEKLPHTRFLMQNDPADFNELIASSTLPSFTTDLAKKYLGGGAGRVEVPISDPEASVTYRLACLRENRGKYRALFSALDA